MPARLKLTLAYDGSSFAGWQSQKHGNTIQDQLEKVFARVAGKRLRVHGAGRTDAGVHALGQCAHADLPDRRRSPHDWQRTLNALLPATIRIMRARYVSSDFHARFSAKEKLYRYQIWAAPVLPPFEAARSWHIAAPLDFEKIVRASAVFVGRHDFAGFAANRGKPETDTIRTIHEVRARKSGPLVTIHFRGDGFLYKMVRLMTGAIVDYALGKISDEDIKNRFSSPHSASAARRLAPATGLVLVRVYY